MSFHLAGTQLAPLDLARIGFRNALRATNGSVVASSTATGYSAQSVKNAQTFDRWRAAGSSATLFCSFPTTQIQFVGIGGHNFAEATGNVSVNISVGGTTLFNGTVNKFSSGLYFEVNNVTNNGLNITITTSGGVPEVGCVFIGQSLIMQRPLYGGHSPINQARITDRTVNLSETGEMLGAYVRNTGLQSTFSWRHLEADWYAANFDPLAEYIARSSAAGLFIAWNPEANPDSVAFGWSASNPRPVNMGVRDFQEVSLTIRGHVSLGSEPRFT